MFLGIWTDVVTAMVHELRVRFHCAPGFATGKRAGKVTVGLFCWSPLPAGDAEMGEPAAGYARERFGDWGGGLDGAWS